jgi:hypothetical protein
VRDAVLIASLVLAALLTGLTWTIQVVHFPALADVGAAELHTFHANHSARITLLVGPLMLAEAGLAVALLGAAPGAVALAQLGLVGLIWASTLFVQVPLHARIAAGDAAAISALVATNWARTVAWSARAALLAAWMWRARGA